jgi:nitronate monooxygenase
VAGGRPVTTLAFPPSPGSQNSQPEAPKWPGNAFTKQVGIELPIVGGAMYPCSNAELVAAVSECGGIGIVQPLSLLFVHGRGRSFRENLRDVQSRTSKPIGMNVLTEKSSKVYLDRMSRWVDEALEEGVRFFVTSLGNPRWIVERVRSAGGIVYHDVTEEKWALKALEAGVHGLVCVNNRAGGHAGSLSAKTLMETLSTCGVPLLCAGGVSTGQDVRNALTQGYLGVQLGTRFIATTECRAQDDYKAAIVRATENDIVLTDRISGVPVSIIRTPEVERLGTRAGPVARWMLRHPKYKHWMRTFYSAQSLWKLRKASLKGSTSQDSWQAGKSVQGIDAVESVAEVMASLSKGLC